MTLVYYVAIGAKHRNLALLSIESLRVCGWDEKVVLATDEPLGRRLENVDVLLVRNIAAKALKTFADRLFEPPYERIAVIDADTIWVDDPGRLLNHPGEFVLVRERGTIGTPGSGDGSERYHLQYLDAEERGRWAEKPCLNSGQVLLSAELATRLCPEWRKALCQPSVFPSDQAALSAAIWRLGLSPVLVAPELVLLSYDYPHDMLDTVALPGRTVLVHALAPSGKLHELRKAVAAAAPQHHRDTLLSLLTRTSGTPLAAS